MQQSKELELMCPEHNEKIISVEISEKGESKTYCLKCFTKSSITIEQLSQELEQLIKNKIERVSQHQIVSEKKLTQLKKVFIVVKDQFNQSINEIIQRIDDEIKQMAHNINGQISDLKNSFATITLSSLVKHIRDLKTESPIINDNISNIKDMVIEEYQQLLKSLNIQFEQVWKQDNENQEQNNQNVSTRQQQVQQNVGIFELQDTKTDINGCLAMAINKNDSILVNGQLSQILLWDMKDGQFNLKQTLRGHSDYVLCLCFSKKSNWFISGSRDKSLRIWKEQGDWICQQILEGHSNYVTDVVLNNEEDQIITSSQDKKIKVWMYDTKWECRQTLTQPTLYIYCLSLSPNGNYLVSCGFDKIRIWLKDTDKLWKQQQMIEPPKQDYFLKICFTDDNEFIATNKQQGKLFKFVLSEQGLFQLTLQFQLNDVEELDVSRFSIAYIKQLRLAICRHGRENVYILSKQQNGEYQLHQTITGNYLARCVSLNGKYLILGENKLNQIQIWQRI